MDYWLQKINQISNNIPKILYHATYAAYVDSILEKGLIPRYVCTWEDCQYGVYLAIDADMAQSFPETTDNPNIPDEYTDNIAIFLVNTSQLDKTKFSPDPHYVLDYPNLNEPEKQMQQQKHIVSWIYKDIIPVTAIRLINNY